MTDSPIAIVAGKGRLPELLAASILRSGREVILIMAVDFRPSWATGYTVIDMVFEKPGALFKKLHAVGCREIIFAGSMERPRLNPLKFDKKMLSIAVNLLPALKGGDSKTLKVIRDIFEAEGLNIIGAHEYLSELLAPIGTLTKKAPLGDDFEDIVRARAVVKQLGAADAGQGAVVAQGLCLGLETVQGTDAMLDFVAKTAERYKPDPKAGQGVLLKAPKPGQDWAIDLPAIGPDTVENAAKAGLNGIALQGESVLILGLEETIATANRLGVFIHAFDPSDAD